MVPNGYTSERPGPYWSNPPFFNFLHSGSLALREPECQKLKNGGLDQYGPERFGRVILLQSEKCGTERVKFRPMLQNVKSCKRDVHEKYMDHYKRINFAADKNISRIFNSTRPVDIWFSSGSTNHTGLQTGRQTDRRTDTAAASQNDNLPSPPSDVVGLCVWHRCRA